MGTSEIVLIVYSILPCWWTFRNVW